MNFPIVGHVDCVHGTSRRKVEVPTSFPLPMGSYRPAVADIVAVYAALEVPKPEPYHRDDDGMAGSWYSAGVISACRDYPAEYHIQFSQTDPDDSPRLPHLIRDIAQQIQAEAVNAGYSFTLKSVGGQYQGRDCRILVLPVCIRPGV